MKVGRIMKTGWAFVVAALLISSNAWGREIYCDSRGVAIYDGADLHMIWHVVNSKVRTVQIPGQTKPTAWCGAAFNTAGEIYRPIEIIQRPKLGQARVAQRYMVGYTSAKSGHDAMAIRIHWLMSGGKPASAVIHIDVDVTDKPL
jgi:hypothetical protein